MRLEQILFSQGFGTRHECRGLIALGPHEKLLETCETYKEIYDSQFKKESDMTRQKEV